ncbi:hypothetical protein Noda2021_00230 [Candidatus Dependentiae bacterium Noda2021]|nr:hypothetical protein Noda2021_00230 [Candidatus Dependentiae bacterium Noda2021]
MNNKILRGISLMVVAVSHIALSYVNVDGPGHPLATFNFPINNHIVTYNNDVQASFFAGAKSGCGAKEFALSRIGAYHTFTEPLAPEKVTLNDDPEVDNPLYDNGIDHLGLMCGNRLFVVPTNSTVAYLIENTTSFRNIAMACTQPLCDAQGKPASRVMAVAGTGGPQEQPFAFFAVQPESNSFGQEGSGIAFAVPVEVRVKIEDEEKKEVKEVIKKVFTQVQGQQTDFPQETRATPLSISSDALKIGNDLSGLGTIVSMHWNTRLGVLYIGLQTEAGSDKNDGARAVVVGCMSQDNILMLHPIMAESVVVTGAENEIVASRGAHTKVTIHHMKSMHTSTSLDYLIVVGGNEGAECTTKRMVCALPLANYRTEKGAPTPENMHKHGQLAHKHALPEDLYGGSNNVFLGRRFRTLPAEPHDILTLEDPAARVGGGQLPYGDIADVAVHEDVVFVTVGDAQEGHTPGIFFSRALLDEHGRVKGWSQWARAARSTDPVWGIKYNSNVGSFIALTDSVDGQRNLVTQTTWSTGDTDSMAGLVDLVCKEFPESSGGVQGFFDFPYQTPGLGNSSLAVAVGLKKVMVIETSVCEDQKVKAHTGSDFCLGNTAFNDIVLTPTPDTTTLVCAGHTCEQLGAITTATIASGYDQSTLVVGGVKGVAVLCDPSGKGWNTHEGLAPHFANLAGFSFTKIGDYSFVRKVIADENYLYVLTDTVFDRIAIDTSNFATNTLDITRLATHNDGSIAQKNIIFTDALVSNKLALLATSQGLYRIGNGNDCRRACNSLSCQWTPVLVPGTSMPILQLVGVSSTSVSTDFAKHEGGMLYVLSGYRGTNRSRLNRFSVNSLINASIDDSVLMHLPDVGVMNQTSTYANMGSYRNAIVSDGSMLLNCRDKEFSEKLVLNAHVRGIKQPIPLDLKEFNHVSALVRNSAVGCWMISGDFGLRVHE